MDKQAHEIVANLQRLYGEHVDVDYSQLCKGSWTILASGVCGYMVPDKEALDTEFAKHPVRVWLVIY